MFVFKLRMEEDVSSISERYFSSKRPFLGDFSFKVSTSTGVTLRIIASSMEQSADIPMVKLIAIINSGSKFIPGKASIYSEALLVRLNYARPRSSPFKIGGRGI